jgi:hypothetical protein
MGLKMGLDMSTKIIDQQVQNTDLVDLAHLESVRPSWAKFSLVEQMANIGSEVHRTLLAKNSPTRYWGAVTRALDVFWLTIEDPRWKGRRREILRARELFAAAALGSDEFKTSLEDLDRYFDCFAWLARADS